MEDWFPLDCSPSPCVFLHPCVAWLGSPGVTMATRTGAAWRGLRREAGEKKREGRARLQSPTSTRNPPGVGSGRDTDTTVQAQLLFSGKHLCPSASSLVFLHLHVFSPFSAHLAHAPFLIFTPRRVFPSIFVLPTFVVLFFPPLLFFMSLLPFSPPSSLRVN